MKILMLHNYYRHRGGEDVSAEAEAQLLRDYGHHVDLLTLSNDDLSTYSMFLAAAETVWSQRAFLMVKKAIQQKKYDLVHVQNFFPRFSTSVYKAAKQFKLPVIQALRNYRLLCLNALLFRNDSICQLCITTRTYFPGLIFRCYRNSFKASFVVATMLIFNKLRHTWQNDVDIYYTPTKFAAQKFSAVPIAGDKIIIKPNFILKNPFVEKMRRSSALYIGRLTNEKGFDLIMEVFNKLKYIPINIVGIVEKSTIKEYPNQANIHYYYSLRNEEIFSIINNSLFLIMPSRSYETFGRVIIEAFACGTPVIASNLGAMAEIVEHGRTGLLFEPGDAKDLAAKVQWAWSHPQQMAEMGKEARREYELKYTAERNYQMLMDIYQKAIDHHRQKN